MIIRRSYLEKLEIYLHRDVIKVITGVRRSGKTTLIKQFIDEIRSGGVPDESILYINLEDVVNSYIDTEEPLRDILVSFAGTAGGHVYIFLDEVQSVKGWANVASEMMNLHDCDIYVTASNKSVFDTDFARVLAYRYIKIEVWPFSFSEYMEIASSEHISEDREERPSKMELFEGYLRRGTMPGSYAFAAEGAMREYLVNLYNTIILRDVVQCNNLREVSHIEKIMEHIMSHMGEAFSPKGIKDAIAARGITISVDTVYSCLDALCGSYLIYKLPRYDVKADRELETIEKYYICDINMRNAVMGDGGVPLKILLDNVICLEMLGRGFRLNVAKSGKSLIDLMASRGSDRTYLNICESVADKESEKKAFGPLTRIRDNYFKMVLTMDPQTIVNRGGIINFPIVDFLSQG